MRPATAATIVVLIVSLGAVVGLGLLWTGGGGELTPLWVSDTARDNEVNHHAIGAGPDGDVVVAPLAEVPNSDVPITDTSCSLVRLTTEVGAVGWQEGVPAADCFTHALTEPAIADLDDDGDLEVAVSSTQNALVVRAADTGRERFRVPLETYGYGRPTVADVLPAEGAEVVTSDIAGGVVLAGAEGEVRWRRSLNRTVGRRVSVWAAPAVADVDADDDDEVVLGTSVGPVVLGPRGSVEWSGRGGATYLATADVDTDDAVEVLTAESRTVRARDGATGDVQWTRDLEHGARIRDAADADGDGTPELFVGLTNGQALALDARTGRTRWTTTVSGAESALVSPVLADVDGDRSDEVVVATRGGTVMVLDASDGAELGRYERSVPIWTFPTPADIDDDGRAEVLVMFGDARVVALAFGPSG